MSASHFRVLCDADRLSPSEIAKADFESLKGLFGDEKVARQVLNAAKRASKKRSFSEASTSAVPAPAPPKRARSSYGESIVFDPATFEASLALPQAHVGEEQLKDTVVYTNRAPLVIAFAVSLLKYTMPEQPLSSRLSLAQAVCSANSQSKAKYIGLQKTNTAEEEGWGEGQPLIRVLGREIRVMKRWGYSWTDEREASPASSQGTIQGDTEVEGKQAPGTLDEPALWGVDLEALKKSNGPVTIGDRKSSASDLPIYKPQSTRAYIMKAFDSKPTQDKQSPTKKNAASVKEQNLGMLLRALDMLYQSWSSTLSKEDLDKRAWSWYVSVRPEVKAGAAGWGGKGNVALSDILELRRPAS